MAYAALVSLANTIDQTLNHRQYSISLHKKQNITSIDKYVIFLQAFLEEFPEKASNLEARIRDVANEAEDIIEYFTSEKICSAVQFDFQLKKVTEKLDAMAEEVMKIKNSLRIKDVGPNDFYAASSSISRLTPTTKNVDMVGFDDDLIAIKTRLCGESTKLQVIPIVGMGGIGKTTLARNSYDDPLTMQYFDIRAWVTISQQYSVEEILFGLLVSMKVSNAERFRDNNELISEIVYKSLKGRRYLIVMDDMWSTRSWDDVRKIFPDDDNGSRIMLTTRLADVAAYADSSSPLHEMRFLDADQSWNLLRQKVFAYHDCPSELEDIGKEIATNCRGLPLAIVVIAGILSTVSETPASWRVIAENVNSAVATKDGRFEKILSLSYTHLPHHLRPCFLYMGGFPEDYEIRVLKLIKLWGAEGFLKPSLSKSFEKAAEEYLEDLVNRSLVLVTKRKSNGEIKSCSVHDLVRDLCIRKAHEEKFLLHVMDTDVPLTSIKYQRRVSIAHSDLNCITNIYGSTIRTIICFQRRGTSLVPLGNFRLLRVLDVVKAASLFGSKVSLWLPAELFELIHLRYLAVHYYTDIPAAISNLRNLQTLIIHPVKILWTNEPATTYLPLEIWRMPQLRHLVSLFGYLPNPDEEGSPLENLQTLSVAKDFICTKRNLKMIPNLKKMGVFYFVSQDLEFHNDEDYHLYNLVYLHQLEKLNLSIQGGFPLGRKQDFAFPRMLKSLTLSGWRFPWTDMTIVGSLPNLQVLKLRNYACEGDVWETSEGEFPKLKFLLIDQSDLKNWITESSHFPSLKCLLLHSCWYLSEIPDDIGEIPTLELIEVEDGNKSLVESAKRIQEEQQSSGNDALRVRCTHSDQVRHLYIP